LKNDIQFCPFCREKIQNFKPNYEILEIIENFEPKPNNNNQLVLQSSSQVNVSQSLISCQHLHEGGYLDGGPHHIRSRELGTGNSSWIEWKLIQIEDDDGYYFIQCKQHNGYLDGGPNHIRSYKTGTETYTNWIRWKLIPNDDGYYFIQCKQHNGYLDGGPNHIRSFETDTNWIKWKLKQKEDRFLIQCKQPVRLNDSLFEFFNSVFSKKIINCF
jgi:hypothetical protein